MRSIRYLQGSSLPALIGIIALVVLLVVGAVWFFGSGIQNSAVTVEPSISVKDESVAGTAPSASSRSSNNTQGLDATTEMSPSIESFVVPADVAIDPDTAAAAAGLFKDDPPTNAGMKQAIERLRSDEAFRLAVMDQLRSETDPERLRTLGFVLGEAGVDFERLSLVANDMLYSGDPAQEKAALYVLGRTQVSDPMARQVVIDVLESSASPTVLLGALNALAREIEPTAAPSEQQRTRVLQQISTLTQHEDPKVRSLSHGILYRWGVDDRPEMVPTLVQGLSDSEDVVRRAAVFGMLSSPIDSPDIREALLQMAENAQENKQYRGAAAMKLEALELDPTQQARVAAVREVVPR